MATEMRRINPAVIGLSETHWTQARQKRIDLGEMKMFRTQRRRGSQRILSNVMHPQMITTTTIKTNSMGGCNQS